MKNKDRQNNSNPDEVRIGVFICDCGTNIAGVINVAEVVEFAKQLDGVVFADEGKWICSVDYLSKIKEYISEYNLNRVVVACCTPRTHEPTFKSTVKEAGLNPFLLEFVSIREQDSWVHKESPELASEKAKDLVHMGVAKARWLEPGEELRIPVGKECLVIGGGIAGLTSALALGDLGFNVILVEKNSTLGGLLNKLDKVAPLDKPAKEIIQLKIDRVQQHENITVYLNTEVSELSGYVGNFNIKLNQRQISDSIPTQETGEVDKTFEHEVSTIIVASGMREIEPVNTFGYGKFPNVMTQLQFEELLQKNKEQLANIKDIAFINCVNSRNIDRGCCNVGCISSIKNIKTVKEINKNINAYIFFRDFNITGMDVQYHYDAMDKYAAAFRYPDDAPPSVLSSGNPNSLNRGKRGNNGRLSIESYDILTGSNVKLEVDLLVLTTGFKGDDSAEKLKGLLKVSTNSDGFFQEAHVKLRPLDFANEGIYICGCARSPKDVRNTIEESMGAAMRAAIPMNKSFVETEGIVANINPDACISCGLCMDVCAFGATEVIDNESQVIQAICKGCGICAASCPDEAISIVHYSDSQILAQVDATLDEKPEEKIIAFACHWCALGAVDNAGISRFEYPPNIRIIRVMCSGRIDPKFILHAFECGAAGVLVSGCEFPTCHYIDGNYYASKKMQFVKKLLELVKINPNRLRVEWLSAAEGAKFAKVVNEFTDELRILGPISNDKYTHFDLQAAIAAASSERLRIIVTKAKEFVDVGNKHSEIFTLHELERLLDEIVYDEFINQKILLSIQNLSKSVKTLSKELGVSSVKVLRITQDLKQTGEVKFDRVEGNSPLYTATSKPEMSSEINKLSETHPNHPDEGSVTHKASYHEFDCLITGSRLESLKRALELASNDEIVCLVSPNNSLINDSAILTADFSDYSKFDEDNRELIEQVYNNDNITVFRNTSIGNGNNKLNNINNTSSHSIVLNKRATYVDETKCDNCGECLKVCPIKVIDFDSYGLINKRAIYQPKPLTKSQKIAISKAIPYCQASCPIMMDVRGYIGKIADGDIEGAYGIIRKTNPLPDVCGKVCDHACEITCARGFKDESLAIRKLKRFATESEYNSFEKSNRKILSKPTKIKNRNFENKVAIIGSGPAGLAAAHDLARLGYPVTIFEALSEPGGMLRVGIPNFRLPHTALQKELNAILDLGVEMKLDTPLGPNLTINDLKSQGYKAVFIGIGAHKSLKLNIEGENLAGVFSGLDFLREYNLNDSKESTMIEIGNRVAIIGGGNVAIDCARMARRLGAEKVCILYRRTKNEMPADKDEIAECEAEGVTIEYLVSPKRILGEENSNKINAIECQRNELGAPDASGRRRPVPINGSEFSLEIDTVLTAIGQEPNLNFITENDNFRLTKRSTFIVDQKNGATNVDGVFVGGDAVSGPANVIGAIEGGKAAARGIDEYLSGNLEDNLNVYNFNGEVHTSQLELMRLRKNLYIPNIGLEPERFRTKIQLVDALQRITHFEEVELPITEEEAKSEAGRCLSCRMCIGCGVCQAVCLKNAVDYSLEDEKINIVAKKIIHHPSLVENGFHNNELLKNIYKNSMNAITLMELECILYSSSDFDGMILRPFDGEIPQNIAFIYLPQSEFISDEEKKFNYLEFHYMLRLLRYIQDNYPEINLKLLTNTMEISELPTGFQHLEDHSSTAESLKDIIINIKEDKFKITEQDNSSMFEIENKGEKHNFDLLVIGAGLRFTT